MTSGSSYSNYRDKRKVSFDLLAEMAVLLPTGEQPLKKVLVEVGDKGQEEESMDMGDICDGSSTSGSDGENGRKRGGGNRQRHISEEDDEDEACGRWEGWTVCLGVEKEICNVCCFFFTFSYSAAILYWLTFFMPSY